MTQSCRAKRRRWSELRHSATTARSAGVRLQCRASSSSLGSTGIGGRRRACGAAAWGSSVDIEVRTLQIGREVVARWSRIDDGRELDPGLTENFEREANVFASEVMFQLDGFSRQAEESEFGIMVPVRLSKTYGSS